MRIRLIYMTVAALLAGSADVYSQAGSVSSIARELFEQLAVKGGAQAAKELAEIGGEKAVQETLEKAYREGGDTLVRQLAKQADAYGPAFLEGAKISPLRFVQAYDALPESLRAGALQAVRREPDTMAALVALHGESALRIAASHPGIATGIVSTLGDDGIRTLAKLDTDQAIRLARLTPDLGKLPVPQRQRWLELISAVPEKILNLLEQHPIVLSYTAALIALERVKDQILGDAEIRIGPDGQSVVVEKPGLIDRSLRQFKPQIAIILLAAGACLVAWAGVHIWRTYALSKIKIRHAEKDRSGKKKAD
jgi:hypothetical protein